jgi:branched-chain amino acid transport system permease protein
MADFLNTYGFLIVSMIFGASLGLSVYLPLMAGQLSLATPGFYALGGYVAAILSTKVFTNTSSNYPLTLVFLEMLVAGIISGILAIVLGIPVLRLRGII